MSSSKKDGALIAGIFGVGCLSIMFVSFAIGSGALAQSSAALVIVGSIIVLLWLVGIATSKGRRLKVLFGGAGLITVGFGPALLWSHFHPHEGMESGLSVSIASLAIAGAIANYLERRRKSRVGQPQPDPIVTAAMAPPPRSKIDERR